MTTQKFSKKYQKWLEYDPVYHHPETPNLIMFSRDFWYDERKDKFIHKDIVDDFLNNTYRKAKKIRRKIAKEKAIIRKEIQEMNRRCV